MVSTCRYLSLSHGLNSSRDTPGMGPCVFPGTLGEKDRGEAGLGINHCPPHSAHKEDFRLKGLCVYQGSLQDFASLRAVCGDLLQKSNVVRGKVIL